MFSLIPTALEALTYQRNSFNVNNPAEENWNWKATITLKSKLKLRLFSPYRKSFIRGGINQEYQSCYSSKMLHCCRHNSVLYRGERIYFKMLFTALYEVLVGRVCKTKRDCVVYSFACKRWGVFFAFCVIDCCFRGLEVWLNCGGDGKGKF